MNELVPSRLYQRLRRPPSPYSVPGSLPVLFFGDLFSAQIVTVGLNPSDKEYTDANDHLLTGARQRFATLPSLGAATRASLSRAQCDEALSWMRTYFGTGKPEYGAYFGHLHRVLSGLGSSLADGSAAHLDLVQEATHPTWSELGKTDPVQHMRLLTADLPFLEWQLRTYPVQAVICTGRTVSDHVRAQMAVRVDTTDTMRGIRWWVGSARVRGRQVGFAGWNIPLHRPNFLGAAGERQLGVLLRQRLGV